MAYFEVMNMKVCVVIGINGCLVSHVAVCRSRRLAERERRGLEAENGVNARNRRHQAEEGNWVEVVPAVVEDGACGE